MSRPFEIASLLLLTSALVSPQAALAQSSPGAPNPPQTTPPAEQPAQITDQSAPPAPEAQEVPEVSVPGGGGEIVVTGRRDRQANLQRSTSQVLSVLSSADIARTGEGDIAGALSRVTGLSVVGQGFVYVRGLGDRYSLALLNGSPLPSPEPLKRVVPLDLFPTNVIASSLVQKSYSTNFPGEFGGGVINLTTKSVPKEGFVSISSNIGVDSESTGQLGYTYFGSGSDWTGFDDGSREVPSALAAFFNSGQTLTQVDAAGQRTIASQLVSSRNAVVQRNNGLPPNWGLSLSAGKSWDIGETTFGLIATFGYSNKWRTRDTLQQTSASGDLSLLEDNFRRIITDNRLVVNGLVGASLEFGRNKIRWTNLYIRDSLKQARYAIGSNTTTSQSATLLRQDTAWFQRQLIDTQLVGEFKLGDQFSLDVRGGYANSKRNVPEELGFEYIRLNDRSPFGQQFVNLLNNGNRGDATDSYSFLNENLYSAGADLTWKPVPEVSATVGYAWQDSYRRSERRQFRFTRGDIAQRLAEQGIVIDPAAIDALSNGIGSLRPDLLLSPAVIQAFGIQLIETSGTPAFGARLRVNAAYGRVVWDPTDKLNVDVGVRYEHGFENVNVIQVFTTPINSNETTTLKRDYWLPALTVTYKLNPQMQFRLSGSKTISRPQFRELIFQPYFDPDGNRFYQGNARLVDSQIYNAEGRWEWYFARDQRLSVAGFYKKIDNPIEVVTGTVAQNTVYSYANAPTADLYGIETEVQKYFRLDGVFGDSQFFSTRRLLVIANYTWSQSKIKVGPTDPAALSGFPGITLANQLFRDGVPLTGQSDHLANLEIGLEDSSKLSQQTFLLSYASRRATIRGGAAGGGQLQPDVYEYPGFQLDFVARQGVKLFGLNTEMKLDIRNITGTRYREFQQSGANRVYFNLYDRGTIGTFTLGVNF